MQYCFVYLFFHNPYGTKKMPKIKCLARKMIGKYFENLVYHKKYDMKKGEKYELRNGKRKEKEFGLIV